MVLYRRQCQKANVEYFDVDGLQFQTSSIVLMPTDVFLGGGDALCA